MIKIENLNKNYGPNKAIENLNLELSNGQVVGLLGPNGSGKTTLIKILVGLIRKYSGQVEINGNTPGVQTKASISYLSDKPLLSGFTNIKSAIDYYEDFYEDFDRVKTLNILKSLNLNPNMKTKTLSKGMMEKFHLSLALGRRAKIYILDEPIAGVDPVARDEILDAIIDNIEPESLMIVCTHLVKDIEQIFDTVAFIREGQIIEYVHSDEIRVKYNQSVEERYKEIFGGNHE